MKNLTIIKKLNLVEYINSEYPTRIAENFGYHHLLNSEHRHWDKYSPEVYIVEADPQYNYGLDFKVYLRYKADGINFFKEISYGSASLTSTGICDVYCLSFNLSNEAIERMKKDLAAAGNLDIDFDFDVITFGSDYYDKGESNRKIFRKQPYRTFH
tara:strand:- start:387 stop:854 length:468 start_codon:yes stop_codon:yes gene_type:complete